MTYNNFPNLNKSTLNLASVSVIQLTRHLSNHVEIKECTFSENKGRCINQDDRRNVWDRLMIKHNPPKEAWKFGSILTLPATGSEWNKNSVISRRDIGWKLGNNFI
ncbi:hypothetical protein M9Y10_019823 [Tritrichomonas musculus]|uniref:Uncharacterized protein n=1 Tax=Tritrichomonas musculus TaxID=1915356 RepID=A0ABR2HHC6_9EUKA